MIGIEQFINTIHSAVLSANDALMKENLKLLDTYFEETDEVDKKKGRSALKAKTVALQFPEQTSNGTEMRDIHVPLITLIPVSMAQVAEVKFRTNLEIQVEKNELLVSFPQVRSAAEQGATPAAQSSSIEITISPQQSSEGLKKLIEGYEKLLRSQIPN
jgi:hypothetical protein